VYQFFADLAASLDASVWKSGATYLLEIRRFVPIVQTLHLLSVAAVMGSIVMIDLRVLRLALPSHRPQELVHRVMPWLWAALPVLLLSGLVQVFGRPTRYLTNPVFGLKFVMLLPAVALAGMFHWTTSRDDAFWERSVARRAAAKAVAACSLCLWVGVVMAGRWIAYWDYLFPPE
jgi:hypothetical protein